jgi:hypothetical protein
MEKKSYRMFSKFFFPFGSLVCQKKIEEEWEVYRSHAWTKVHVGEKHIFHLILEKILSYFSNIFYANTCNKILITREPAEKDVW